MRRRSPIPESRKGQEEERHGGVSPVGSWCQEQRGCPLGGGKGKGLEGSAREKEKEFSSRGKDGNPTRRLSDKGSWGEGHRGAEKTSPGKTERVVTLPLGIGTPGRREAGVACGMREGRGGGGGV